MKHMIKVRFLLYLGPEQTNLGLSRHCYKGIGRPCGLTAPAMVRGRMNEMNVLPLMWSMQTETNLNNKVHRRTSITTPKK